ncbi:MAG: TetR/AcrR family transcriptional regulator [Congregibacter sp.]
MVKRARSDDAKDSRRGELLRAALDELFERGFAGARMEDIAVRANVTKGTLYIYFPSKDALFRALIERYAKPNLAQLEAVILAAPSLAEALAGVATFAPHIIRETSLPKLVKVLIGESQSFPDVILEYRKEVIDRIFHALAQLLEQSQKRQEIKVTDPSLTARLVIAPIAFSALWQAVFGQHGGGKVDLEELFQLHANMLLEALSIPPSGKESTQ